MTDAEKIIDLLKKVEITSDNSTIMSDDETPIECPFEITPEEFIEFAETDLEGNDNRSSINALSNAKRAIDSTADFILGYMHIESGKVKKDKLTILNEMGIVAPRVIRKLRAARNLMEHEYKLPLRESIEDAVDVATLFIGAARRIIDAMPDCALVFNADTLNGTDGRLFASSLDICYSNKQFQIQGCRSNVKFPEVIEITNKSSLYYDICVLIIRAKMKPYDKVALEAFYAKIGYVAKS